MSADLTMTAAGAIALPVEMVELQHLKTKDGSPVVVRVERIDELRSALIMQRLPGGIPQVGPADGGEGDTQAGIQRALHFSPFVEACALLTGEDGRLVQAFYFGDEPPHPLCIPGRLLRVQDFVLLLTAALRQNGYLWGDSPEGAFPAEDGAGLGDGSRAVASVEGDGPDAVGGAA